MSNTTELENTNGFSFISGDGASPPRMQGNAEDPDNNLTSTAFSNRKHADNEPFIIFEGQSSFLPGPPKNNPPRVSVQKFPCGVCGKKLASKGALHNHLAALHAREKPYTCDHCEKRFSIPRCLAQHMITHTRVKMKDLSFTGKKLLLPSRNSGSRSGGEPFQCDLCGEKFFWQYKLTRHFREAHDDAGERPFVCSVCGERFGFEFELSEHQLQSHGSSEESFVCDICEASFKKKGELNFHLRSHTAAERFECAFCKKKFRHRYAMVVHHRTHTGEMPYECDVCHKKFANLSVMQWHRANHT